MTEVFNYDYMDITSTIRCKKAKSCKYGYFSSDPYRCGTETYNQDGQTCSTKGEEPTVVHVFRTLPRYSQDFKGHTLYVTEPVVIPFDIIIRDGAHGGAIKRYEYVTSSITQHERQDLSPTNIWVEINRDDVAGWQNPDNEQTVELKDSQNCTYVTQSRTVNGKTETRSGYITILMTNCLVAPSDESELPCCIGFDLKGNYYNKTHTKDGEDLAKCQHYGPWAE